MPTGLAVMAAAAALAGGPVDMQRFLADYSKAAEAWKAEYCRNIEVTVRAVIYDAEGVSDGRAEYRFTANENHLLCEESDTDRAGVTSVEYYLLRPDGFFKFKLRKNGEYSETARLAAVPAERASNQFKIAMLPFVHGTAYLPDFFAQPDATILEIVDSGPKGWTVRVHGPYEGGTAETVYKLRAGTYWFESAETTFTEKRERRRRVVNYRESDIGTYPVDCVETVSVGDGLEREALRIEIASARRATLLDTDFSRRRFGLEDSGIYDTSVFKTDFLIPVGALVAALVLAAVAYFCLRRKPRSPV